MPKAKNPVKAGEVMLVVNEKDLNGAMNMLMGLTNSNFGGYLKRDNPLDKLLGQIEDRRVGIEDIYEQCPGCKGEGYIEALWLYPFEEIVPALKRMVSRAIYQQMRLSHDQIDPTHLAKLEKIRAVLREVSNDDN